MRDEQKWSVANFLIAIAIRWSAQA